MKKLLFFFLLSTTLSFAQTFSDNFDGYIAGLKLAQQSSDWTTWDNTPGGADDALISNTRSFSPSNSVYFSSNTQAGGPTDLVKQFGEIASGQLSIEWNIFVETNKAAYFNFQQYANLGQSWALHTYFRDNGTIDFANYEGQTNSINYPQNSWFNLRFEINLNTNNWEVYINDVLELSFLNTINQLAAINFFPQDDYSPYNSAFYVDDFSYQITPYSLPPLNLSITNIKTDGAYIPNMENAIITTVKNLGQQLINSAELNYSYNNVNYSQNFSNLNLSSNESVDLIFNQSILFTNDQQNLIVSITNVNNQIDDDLSDNSKTKVIDPIKPAPGKVVVGEVYAATWCQWCPRGTVETIKLENKYAGIYQSVVVHASQDPMTNQVHSDGIGTLADFIPSILIDRQNSNDCETYDAERNFLKQIVIPPIASINHQLIFDSITRELTINTEVLVLHDSIDANFQDYKIATIIREDSVRGTNTDYNQENIYSGGLNGEMGGFELLSNPVPFNQIYYRNVSRKILPSFYGDVLGLTTNLVTGQTYQKQFTATLPSSWNENRISVISFLIKNNGEIENAGTTKLQGHTNYLALPNNQFFKFHLQPNPASDFFDISSTDEIISMTIRDLSGKICLKQAIHSNKSTINTSNLSNTMYIVEVETTNGTSCQKILINN